MEKVRKVTILSLDKDSEWVGDVVDSWSEKIYEVYVFPFNGLAHFLLVEQKTF